MLHNSLVDSALGSQVHIASVAQCLVLLALECPLREMKFHLGDGSGGQFHFKNVGTPWAIMAHVDNVFM